VAGVEGRRDPPPASIPGGRSWYGMQFIGAFVWLAGCTYDVTLGSVTYPLPATSCGTWDSLGAHTTGDYFVGHRADAASSTLSYFVFDLSPIRGRTVVTAGLTIPGTDDWKFTVTSPETPPLQFRLAVRPLPSGLSLTQVTTGSDDSGVYQDVEGEEDLGWAWEPSGDLTNTYGAFTYSTARLQSAVDAGGLYPLFAVQDFGPTTGAAEYLFGGGVCGPGIELTVSVE
jgi:hypothetical protein